MHIEFVEIQNFRKLKSIRIDISKEATVFVGSNNSGKTSAMIALGHFLVDQGRFSTNDFTLSNWKGINKIGRDWEKLNEQSDMPDLTDWVSVIPSLDIWLNVAIDEIHHVRNLIPSLDWDGGLLGVRLRFEPKDTDEFYKEYIQARRNSKDTVAAAKLQNEKMKYTLSLWPGHMGEFLSRKLNSLFTVRAYLLDPEKVSSPTNGLANPQEVNTEPVEGNILKELIRIDEINAQRGFSDSRPGDSSETGGKKKLSEQLRLYFSKHIDPSDAPDPSDVDALQAIHEAQSAFDAKLKTSFDLAFKEIGGLGYPGLNDLELILSTRIHPMDGLNHPSALQYKVNPNSTEESDSSPCLPEQYNGLGYQNLISMVFRLMSFRDHWMKVGKVGKKVSEDVDKNDYIPPLHLVLVEEPEAHLHVQVQQVFIRKAYEILRRHPDLGSKSDLTTQLIVTTHSSHIAHECEFSWLRYFRRRPTLQKGEVPTTTVVNLSEVFGKQTDTQKFVTRYLRTTHCDLFFADATILVEGPAERILVPHFIRHHFPKLHQSYVTILEISGSHAHTLRPLIEHLGLVTLVITDIDAATRNAKKNLVSVPLKRNDNQVSGNSTLRTWVPAIKSLDNLLDLDFGKKCIEIDKFSSVRACYQIPINVTDSTGISFELLPNTFEDALFYQNILKFPGLTGRRGLLKKLKAIISENKPFTEYGQILFELLEKADKAEFALDILFQDVNSLTTPTYISEGLEWLQDSLEKKLLDNLIQEAEVINKLEATQAVEAVSETATEIEK